MGTSLVPKTDRQATARRHRGHVAEIAIVVMTELSLGIIGLDHDAWVNKFGSPGLIALFIAAGLVAVLVGRGFSYIYHYWHSAPIALLEGVVTTTQGDLRRAGERIVKLEAEVDTLTYETEEKWLTEFEGFRGLLMRFMSVVENDVFPQIYSEKSIWDLDALFDAAVWPHQLKVDDEGRRVGNVNDDLLTVVEYFDKIEVELQHTIKMTLQRWGNRLESRPDFKEFLDKNLSQSTMRVVRIFSYIEHSQNYGADYRAIVERGLDLLAEYCYKRFDHPGEAITP